MNNEWIVDLLVDLWSDLRFSWRRAKGKRWALRKLRTQFSTGGLSYASNRGRTSVALSHSQSEASAAVCHKCHRCNANPSMIIPSITRHGTE